MNFKGELRQKNLDDVDLFIKLPLQLEQQVVLELLLRTLVGRRFKIFMHLYFDLQAHKLDYEFMSYLADHDPSFATYIQSTIDVVEYPCSETAILLATMTRRIRDLKNLEPRRKSRKQWKLTKS